MEAFVDNAIRLAASEVDRVREQKGVSEDRLPMSLIREDEEMNDL